MTARIVLRRIALIAVASLVTSCGGDSTGPDGGGPEPEPPTSKMIWRSVDLGSRHACGLSADGTAYCWGLNGSGELGVGVTGGLATAPVRVETDRKFQVLVVGISHTCALTAAGETFCWGESGIGFLNDGLVAPVNLPTRVVGVPVFRTIAAGAHTCGLSESGEVTCWEGRPIPVPAGLPAFQSLALGWSHFCGLTAAGEAYCWGESSNGQLGRLGGDGRAVVVGEGLRFRSIAAGKDHMCGIAESGVPYCWGLNQKGQLGIGTISDTEPVTPVATALLFDAVSVGAQSSCGLVRRTAYCWAFNGFAQVGDGTLDDRLRPVPVAGGHDFVLLAVGDFGSPEAGGLPSVNCGVTTFGAAYCWGYSSHGQLGAGPRKYMNRSPVRVVEPVLLP